MYQYILNIDAVREAEQKLTAMAETFKNVDTPEAKAREKFLLDNLAKVRQAIQAAFHMKTDPKHTISAVFRHVSRGGQIASISLFKQTRGTASKMTSPGGGFMLSTGPKGKRTRYISTRTLNIRNYDWMDRGFILRILNSGSDVRTAHADSHGRGTLSTWGGRGAIGAQNAVKAGEAMMGTLTKEYGEYITQQAAEKLQ